MWTAQFSQEKMFSEKMWPIRRAVFQYVHLLVCKWTEMLVKSDLTNWTRQNIINLIHEANGMQSILTTVPLSRFSKQGWLEPKVTFLSFPILNWLFFVIRAMKNDHYGFSLSQTYLANVSHSYQWITLEFCYLAFYCYKAMNLFIQHTIKQN